MPQTGARGIYLARHERTLVFLIEALRGARVTVETIVGSIVDGVLTWVDPELGLYLSDATMTWEDTGSGAPSAPESTDFQYVSGRFIRYIHLPEDLDVNAVLETKMRSKERNALAGRRRVWVPNWDPPSSAT